MIDDLRWSAVNLFHRAVTRIERELDDNEQAQRRKHAHPHSRPNAWKRDAHKRFGGNRLAARIDLERFGERTDRSLLCAAGGSSGGDGPRRRYAARAGREGFWRRGTICRAASRF